MMHILSLKDFKKDALFALFELAKKMKQHAAPSLLKDKIIMNCFFEPSTRTRLSFEIAMKRLGGEVVNFSEPQNSSLAKGESFQDTIAVLSRYADLLVLRHPLEGAARLASEISSVPVINAGDGSNQHPTQTLLDLFTILEGQKKLEGLDIALCGDLRFGRTIHSFASIAHLFNFRLYLVPVRGLEMPENILQYLRQEGVKFSCHNYLEDLIGKLDVLYMTRLQKERFLKEHKHITAQVLHKSMLKNARSNLQILHPLPRNEEIDKEIDSTPYASYFQQAENGLHIRKALLATSLGASL